MAIQQRNRNSLPTHTRGLIFGEAIAACLDRLQHEIPFGEWSMTRLIGDDSVVLYRPGRLVHGTPRGCIPMAETLCARVAGNCVDWPMASDGDGRVSAPVRRSFDLGAYLGVALCRPNGDLSGSLGTMEMRSKSAPRSPRQMRLLEAVGRLAAGLIEHELRVVQQARAAAFAAYRSPIIDGTTWLEAADWQRALQFEDRNRQSLTQPAAVLALSLTEIVRVRSAIDQGGNAALRRGGVALRALFGSGRLGHCCADRRSLLLLIPECDAKAAHALEAGARLLLESRGLRVRVRLLSTRYDHSLLKAAVTAIHAVGGTLQ